MKLEFQTSYQSKKIKDITFGHLFVLKQNWLLSVSPLNCIVLIDMRTNRLISYEPLKLGKCFSFNQEDNSIYYLSPDERGVLLAQIKVQTLLEHFKDSTGKQAMKLILKQKVLQNLDICGTFVTSLYRKE